MNNLSEIIVVSCKQTESLQPTNMVFNVVGLFLFSFQSRGHKQTNNRRKILETRSTSHMLKDLPERNALHASRIAATNNSQEITHAGAKLIFN